MTDVAQDGARRFYARLAGFLYLFILAVFYPILAAEVITGLWLLFVGVNSTYWNNLPRERRP